MAAFHLGHRNASGARPDLLPNEALDNIRADALPNPGTPTYN